MQEDQERGVRATFLIEDNTSNDVMARMGGDKYPPSEFSQKYASVLAPKGKLVSPADVFGEGKPFAGTDVEEKTRQAWSSSHNSK